MVAQAACSLEHVRERRLLTGVEVDLYDASDDELGSTCTAADGTYSFTALATGTYEVGFAPGSADALGGCGPAGNYLEQFYAGQASLGAADPIPVDFLMHTLSTTMPEDAVLVEEAPSHRPLTARPHRRVARRGRGW